MRVCTQIRTAMLKGGKDIYLDKGQDVTVYAAGVEYTTWEGYKDEKTGMKPHDTHTHTHTDTHTSQHSPYTHGRKRPSQNAWGLPGACLRIKEQNHVCVCVFAGETKIGLSYAKLCQSVKPGNIILIADGEISIQVTEITSDKELKGKVRWVCHTHTHTRAHTRAHMHTHRAFDSMARRPVARSGQAMLGP